MGPQGLRGHGEAGGGQEVRVAPGDPSVQWVSAGLVLGVVRLPSAPPPERREFCLSL